MTAPEEAALEAAQRGQQQHPGGAAWGRVRAHAAGVSSLIRPSASAVSTAERQARRVRTGGARCAARSRPRRTEWPATRGLFRTCKCSMTIPTPTRRQGREAKTIRERRSSRNRPGVLPPYRVMTTHVASGTPGTVTSGHRYGQTRPNPHTIRATDEASSPRYVRPAATRTPPQQHPAATPRPTSVPIVRKLNTRGGLTGSARPSSICASATGRCPADLCVRLMNTTSTTS